MKKFLPKSINNPQGFSLARSAGFSLVELMVVISIIAILSVIGAAVYSGVQKNARDAARRSDIESISKAMEVNYNDSTGLYTPLAASMFASGAIPTAVGGVAYTGIPSATSSTATYNVCAVLESGTTFCQKSQRY